MGPQRKLNDVLRAGGLGESGDRGAQVGLGVVPELGDEWVLIERTLDHGPLDATATPVNEPDFAESCLMRGEQILLNHVHDIPRRERVQVERILDRKFVHRPSF